MASVSEFPSLSNVADSQKEALNGLSELVADVLRHRLVLSYQALAEGMTADAIIARLLQHLPAPRQALESTVVHAAAH